MAYNVYFACDKCGYGLVQPLCVFEYLHKAGARSRVEGRETRLDLPKVPAEKEALKDGKGRNHNSGEERR